MQDGWLHISDRCGEPPSPRYSCPDSETQADTRASWSLLQARGRGDNLLGAEHISP